MYNHIKPEPQGAFLVFTDPLWRKTTKCPVPGFGSFNGGSKRMTREGV